MKKVSACFLFFVLLASGAVLHAQSPTTFSYQGRLTEGGALANGLYDFRLSAHDAAAVGNQVGATLPFDDVLVTNGLFVLYPDFGGGVLNGQPRWIEVNVRPGASTGTYTPLTPRQPVVATPMAHVANTVLSVPAGAVGAAQLAAGAITADKLAPAVAQGLAPSGALVASFEESAPNLMANGYVKVPSLFTTVGGWSGMPERNALTNRYSTMGGTASPASLWTGTELFVFGRPDSDPLRFAGNRFNPATGLWNPLPTNAEPRFMGNRRINLVLGGSNVFAFGDVDTTMDNTNSTGGFFDLTNHVWRNIPTNGFTRIFDDGATRRAEFFWTGSEVLAVGTINIGAEFGGALFNPATNGWRLINTNGHPQVDMRSAVVGWTGAEVFVYGVSHPSTSPRSGSGGLYHPGNATWRAASTNNGPSFGGISAKRAVWTGVEFIAFFTSSDFTGLSRFHAYNPQLDTWRPCSTNGMPAITDGPINPVPRLFWTGTEAGIVVRLAGDGGASSPLKAAVYLYHPASDTWRSFVSDTPKLSFYGSVGEPEWTGSEAVAYLLVAESLPHPVPTTDVFRPFRFTPPRTLFFYQKP